MDSGSSQETPGSETKYFTVHSTASGMSINIFVSVALSPKPHGGNMWWTRMTSVHQVGCTAKEELKTKNPGFLSKQQQASLPSPESRQLHDSHDMVTLTYLVVCVTNHRNGSVAGEASQSGVLSKDVQGHSELRQTCLF